MKSLLVAALLVAPVVARAQGAPPEVAAEVDKGIEAYNAGDIKYYEATLEDGVVYVADDGAIFEGKDRVIGLLTRIFSSQPAPQLTIADLKSEARGDVAWVRFGWTRTKGADSRKGVATVIFTRESGSWKVAEIQNTPSRHGAH
jgi:ketosteroid isomerase-like protein